MALHNRGGEAGGGLPDLAVGDLRLKGEPGGAVGRVDMIEIGRGSLGPPPRQLHEVDALVASANELHPAVDVDDAIRGIAILGGDESRLRRMASRTSSPGRGSKAW